MISRRDVRELLRRRGQNVERSFEHVLDDGGARRTSLRGRENIKRRYFIQTMGYNLSLLVRALLGVGTPKRAFATALSAIGDSIVALFSVLIALNRPLAPQHALDLA